MGPSPQPLLLCCLLSGGVGAVAPACGSLEAEGQGRQGTCWVHVAGFALQGHFFFF